jgi:hypothetical protein
MHWGMGSLIRWKWAEADQRDPLSLERFPDRFETDLAHLSTQFGLQNVFRDRKSGQLINIMNAKGIGRKGRKDLPHPPANNDESFRATSAPCLQLGLNWRDAAAPDRSKAS